MTISTLAEIHDKKLILSLHIMIADSMADATRTLEAAIKYAILTSSSSFTSFLNFIFLEILSPKPSNYSFTVDATYAGIDCTGNCSWRKLSKHWRCIKSKYCSDPNLLTGE